MGWVLKSLLPLLPPVGSLLLQILDRRGADGAVEGKGGLVEVVVDFSTGGKGGNGG